MSLQDARIYQIGFLCLFLLLGVSTKDWELRSDRIAVIVCTCIGTQGAAFALKHWQSDREEQQPQLLQSLPSAVITSLGLSLLLRADHYSTLMLASAAAILSKFVLQVQGKHLFNPANFGIIAALTLTQNAWVSPGQWGETQWCGLLFVGTGGVVLRRVGRWDTSIAFLAVYAGLEALRNLWLGWSWDVWAHRLMSGSLLLFALFMITDPRTIPNARSSRVVWAIAIAILTFILRNFYFLPTAAFWALFVLSPVSLLLDRCWPADRFTWQSIELFTSPQGNEP
ncbi:RnfABCDGE type electron transport complex subunit D [Microcoleus sp. FACHB-1515]|uniref:RnfABCDGE type electron transport complex subunit D n=1 Tax=Cyanophyceae TaxID=3028117 RepID=UPI001685E05F|nr:RnfABCDGE type electron transport complex subunit D [Microcoleus sp. FACHB-1515]MBD2091898.1 RnfABCDGE type electron transport complex subunit D [Microcoleus sp. FACHB-1515]